MPSPHIENVVGDITKATTVIKGATVFVNGIRGMIDAAVAAAIVNGATAEELKPVSDVSDAMETEADALAAAVVANTPAARS